MAALIGYGFAGWLGWCVYDGWTQATHEAMTRADGLILALTVAVVVICYCGKGEKS